jgi:hypothetical protein
MVSRRVERLSEQREKIEILLSLPRFGPDYKAWFGETSRLIESIWGSISSYYARAPNQMSAFRVLRAHMAKEGVIEYDEESEKGGCHKVYYPKMTRDEFGQYVVSAIMEKLKTL